MVVNGLVVCGLGAVRLIDSAVVWAVVVVVVGSCDAGSDLLSRSRGSIILIWTWANNDVNWDNIGRFSPQ